MRVQSDLRKSSLQEVVFFSKITGVNDARKIIHKFEQSVG